MSLYKLNAKVRELVLELDQLEYAPNTADLTELKPEEVIADIVCTLDELYTAIDAKRENYCKLIRSATADAKALRAEAKHLVERAKRQEALAAHLKDTLQFEMMSTGEVTSTAGLFKLRISKSPVRVELSVEPELLPKCFQKVAVSPNTNALRQALKDGDVIPGANLVQGTHLRIS